jgi:hypothetical protein
MEEHLVRAARIPEKSWQALIRLHEFDDVPAGFSRQCPPVAAAVRLEYPEAFPMIPLCQTKKPTHGFIFLEINPVAL